MHAIRRAEGATQRVGGSAGGRRGNSGALHALGARDDARQDALDDARHGGAAAPLVINQLYRLRWGGWVREGGGCPSVGQPSAAMEVPPRPSSYTSWIA